MTGIKTRQYSIQRLTLIGLLAFFLSSCANLADPETSQIHQQDVIYTLSADGSDWVGQSFIARREKLNSITIHVSPTEEGSPSAVLVVELYHSPEETVPLFTTRLSARKGGTRIDFPSQAGPPNQGYFLKLSASGQSIQILGRAEETYVEGFAYAKEAILSGDLAFSTTYKYNFITFIDDLKSAFSDTHLLIAALLVLLLPGIFLVNLLLSPSHFDFGEKIAVSVGISLAILPLLMLWTSLSNLPWNRVVVRTGTLALLLGTGFLFFRHKSWKAWRFDLFDGTLIIIFLASLAIRLVMIRDMAGTAWIDSVHHGLLTRLILEEGKLPTSFLPFFEISPTDYHPGFHTSVAVFTWLSGLTMDRAMLVFGQVLNAMIVFAAYLFTTTLTRSRLAGLAAALAAGLCTPMPAYYTTWGRYTQLAGTVILPVPVVLFQNSLVKTKDAWRYIAAACIAAAGLFLVHYRVMAFMGILMGAYFVIYHLIDQSKWPGLSRTSRYAVACVMVTGLLILPWLVPTFTQTIIPLSEPQSEAIQWFSGFSWRFLNTGFGQPIMALAAFGLVAALILKQRFGYLLVFWTAGLFILANPTQIGLPGALLNNTSVAIFLFLPMAVLAGYAVGLVAETWQQVAPALHRPFMVSLAIAGLITGYLGSQRVLPILNSGTILLRQADLPALEWAAANLPADATVAINPFLWGYGVYAGSDGGYWLAPIAGLRTMPPPVLSAMGGWESTSQLSKQLIEAGKDPARLAELLRNNSIEYIYLGARGGVISPSALQTDQQYELLYQAGGVWIFHLTSN